MIHNNFYTKFEQNTTFDVFDKKVEKSHFFSFFETQNRCLTKNVSFVKKMWRFFILNFLNHFLTSFSFKWAQLQKKLKKLIHNNFYTIFEQNTTFHVFEKKVEKSYFFSFFETQNWGLTKNISFIKKMWRFFFLNFLNLFLTSFCFGWPQLQKKLKKMIQNNFYTKFEQNMTFHVFDKKVKKMHFFSFFETQNRCLTKNVSFVNKMWRFFILNFLNHFLTSFCFKWA